MIKEIFDLTHIKDLIMRNRIKACNQFNSNRIKTITKSGLY